MGVKASRQNFGGKFTLQNWSQIEANSLITCKLEQGQYRHLRNQSTGEQIQQYKLLFNNQLDYKNYLNCFLWRKRESYIVSTKYFVNQKLEEICATRHLSMVYIEHIPSRLSDITDIPFPENLYVLNATLKGVEKLFGNIRYFKIQEDLICITREANVKDFMDLSDSALQSKIVNQVVEIISNSTDQETEPRVSFIDYLSKNAEKAQWTFAETRNLLKKYAQEEEIDIPQVFESMLEIMREDLLEENSNSHYNQNDNQFSESAMMNHPLFTHQSSDNIISLPKASHTTIIHQIIPSNQASRQGFNQILQPFQREGQESRGNLQSGFKLMAIPNSQPNSFTINGDISNVSANGGNYDTNSSANFFQTKSQPIRSSFQAPGCSFPRISFSYSSMPHNSPQQTRRQLQDEFVELEDLVQEIDEENRQFQYLRERNRMFRMKSLIEECEEDLETSNNLKRRESLESEYQGAIGRSAEKSKSYSRQKITPPHLSLTEDKFEESYQMSGEKNDRVDQLSGNSQSRGFKKPKNMVMQDQFRIQNSPTSLRRKQDTSKVRWSQINQPKILKRNPSFNSGNSVELDFSGRMNGATLGESNINQLSSFRSNALHSNHSAQQKFFGSERSNENCSKHSQFGRNSVEILKTIPQLNLDPQIVRDLQFYHF